MLLHPNVIQHLRRDELFVVDERSTTKKRKPSALLPPKQLQWSNAHWISGSEGYRLLLVASEDRSAADGLEYYAEQPSSVHSAYIIDFINGRFTSPPLPLVLPFAIQDEKSDQTKKAITQFSVLGISRAGHFLVAQPFNSNELIVWDCRNGTASMIPPPPPAVVAVRNNSQSLRYKSPSKTNSLKNLFGLLRKPTSNSTSESTTASAADASPYERLYISDDGNSVVAIVRATSQPWLWRSRPTDVDQCGQWYRIPGIELSAAQAYTVEFRSGATASCHVTLIFNSFIDTMLHVQAVSDSLSTPDSAGRMNSISDTDIQLATEEGRISVNHSLSLKSDSEAFPFRATTRAAQFRTPYVPTSPSSLVGALTGSSPAVICWDGLCAMVAVVINGSPAWTNQLLVLYSPSTEKAVVVRLGRHFLRTGDEMRPRASSLETAPVDRERDRRMAVCDAAWIQDGLLLVLANRSGQVALVTRTGDVVMLAMPGDALDAPCVVASLPGTNAGNGGPLCVAGHPMSPTSLVCLSTHERGGAADPVLSLIEFPDLSYSELVQLHTIGWVEQEIRGLSLLKDKMSTVVKPVTAWHLILECPEPGLRHRLVDEYTGYLREFYRLDNVDGDTSEAASNIFTLLYECFGLCAAPRQQGGDNHELVLAAQCCRYGDAYIRLVLTIFELLVDGIQFHLAFHALRIAEAFLSDTGSVQSHNAKNVATLPETAALHASIALPVLGFQKQWKLLAGVSLQHAATQSRHADDRVALETLAEACMTRYAKLKARSRTGLASNYPITSELRPMVVPDAIQRGHRAFLEGDFTAAAEHYQQAGASLALLHLWLVTYNIAAALDLVDNNLALVHALRQRPRRPGHISTGSECDSDSGADVYVVFKGQRRVVMEMARFICCYYTGKDFVVLKPPYVFGDYDSEKLDESSSIDMHCTEVEFWKVSRLDRLRVHQQVVTIVDTATQTGHTWHPRMVVEYCLVCGQFSECMSFCREIGDWRTEFVIAHVHVDSDTSSDVLSHHLNQVLNSPPPSAIEPTEAIRFAEAARMCRLADVIGLAEHISLKVSAVNALMKQLRDCILGMPLVVPAEFPLLQPSFGRTADGDELQPDCVLLPINYTDLDRGRVYQRALLAGDDSSPALDQDFRNEVKMRKAVAVVLEATAHTLGGTLVEQLDRYIRRLGDATRAPPLETDSDDDSEGAALQCRSLCRLLWYLHVRDAYSFYTRAALAGEKAVQIVALKWALRMLAFGDIHPLHVLQDTCIHEAAEALSTCGDSSAEVACLVAEHLAAVDVVPVLQSKFDSFFEKVSKQCGAEQAARLRERSATASKEELRWRFQRGDAEYRHLLSLLRASGQRIANEVAMETEEYAEVSTAGELCIFLIEHLWHSHAKYPFKSIRALGPVSTPKPTMTAFPSVGPLSLGYLLSPFVTMEIAKSPVEQKLQHPSSQATHQIGNPRMTKEPHSDELELSDSPSEPSSPEQAGPRVVSPLSMPPPPRRSLEWMAPLRKSLSEQRPQSPDSRTVQFENPLKLSIAQSTPSPNRRYTEVEKNETDDNPTVVPVQAEELTSPSGNFPIDVTWTESDRDDESLDVDIPQAIGNDNEGEVPAEIPTKPLQSSVARNISEHFGNQLRQTVQGLRESTTEHPGGSTAPTQAQQRTRKSPATSRALSPGEITDRVATWSEQETEGYPSALPTVSMAPSNTTVDSANALPADNTYRSTTLDTALAIELGRLREWKESIDQKLKQTERDRELAEERKRLSERENEIDRMISQLKQQQIQTEAERERLRLMHMEWELEMERHMLREQARFRAAKVSPRSRRKKRTRNVSPIGNNSDSQMHRERYHLLRVPGETPPNKHRQASPPVRKQLLVQPDRSNTNDTPTNSRTTQKPSLILLAPNRRNPPAPSPSPTKLAATRPLIIPATASINPVQPLAVTYSTQPRSIPPTLLQGPPPKPGLIFPLAKPTVRQPISTELELQKPRMPSPPVLLLPSKHIPIFPKPTAAPPTRPSTKLEIFSSPKPVGRSEQPASVIIPFAVAPPSPSDEVGSSSKQSRQQQSSLHKRERKRSELIDVTQHAPTKSEPQYPAVDTTQPLKQTKTAPLRGSVSNVQGATDPDRDTPLRFRSANDVPRFPTAEQLLGASERSYVRVDYLTKEPPNISPNENQRRMTHSDAVHAKVKAQLERFGLSLPGTAASATGRQQLLDTISAKVQRMGELLDNVQRSAETLTKDFEVERRALQRLEQEQRIHRQEALDAALRSIDALDARTVRVGAELDSIKALSKRAGKTKQNTASSKPAAVTPREKAKSSNKMAEKFAKAATLVEELLQK